MNKELEINLSDEEMEKIRNLLINNKGLRHYGFTRENGEYLDLVEYKDYEKLQSNWNKIKNYCKKDGDDYLYNVYEYMIALEENKDVSDFEW